MFALRVAGHDVALLAPAASGDVLLGGGPARVSSLLPWESAAFAPLHEDSAALPDSLRRELAAFEAAIAFSRSGVLRKRLSSVIPHSVQRDPTPPVGSGHASLWLAGAVRELEVPVPESDPPTLDVHAPEADELAARLPERFLALHPGSGSRTKNWPAERFAELADALAPAAAFALIQGPADAVAVGRVERLAPRAVVVRDRTARSVAGLLARAGLYVGNDSGVSHLAAAVGVPALALFGPTDPAVWAPLGPRAMTLRAPGADLERLGVASVVDYVSGAWTSSRLMSR